MRKITIKDVAREAGVSITTVSRALNGYTDVSEATKKKVQEVAKRLDYAPDMNARAISSKEITRIGLLISSLTDKDENGFIHGHLCGVYRLCTECGCEFVLLVTETEQQKKQSFRQLCKKNNLSGIVVTGLRTDDPYYSEIMDYEIPCSLIDIKTCNERKCTVATDNITAVNEAIDYLFNEGHRNIALINGSEVAEVSVRRFEGYASALEKHNIALNSEYVRYCDFKENVAYEKTSELLKTHPEITAFFCSSDIMAFGTIRAIHDMGLKVPEDISVMGYDDVPAAKYVYNGLSTIRQNPDSLGYEAGKAVYRMINGEKIGNEVILPYQILIRGTTGKVREN